MRRVLTERDLRVFRFLWKWKISTTAFLHVGFFPDAKAKTAYERLLLLKKAGYLTVYMSNKGAEKLWGLTKVGFSKIRKDLPAFKAEVFKPNSLPHDIRAQAVQLGVFDLVSQQDVVCISEQELRCDPDYLPNFAKDFSHKPDGYWVFNNQNVIAIEVELSHKESQAYYDLAYKYDASEAIKAVLWVVESESFARRILRVVEQFANGSNHKYSIVYYQHFSELSADCRIIGGNFRGEKLSFLLEKMGAKRFPTNDGLIRTQALSNHKIRCW